MPAREIKLEDHTKCPFCKGTKGIKFALKGQVHCSNNWGNNPSGFESDNVTFNESPPKTAKCADCGRVLYIL